MKKHPQNQENTGEQKDVKKSIPKQFTALEEARKKLKGKKKKIKHPEGGKGL